MAKGHALIRGAKCRKEVCLSWSQFHCHSKTGKPQKNFNTVKSTLPWCMCKVAHLSITCSMMMPRGFKRSFSCKKQGTQGIHEYYTYSQWRCPAGAPSKATVVTQCCIPCSWANPKSVVHKSSRGLVDTSLASLVQICSVARAMIHFQSQLKATQKSEIGVTTKGTFARRGTRHWSCTCSGLET